MFELVREHRKPSPEAVAAARETSRRAPLPIQFRLTVGRTDDPAEREADAIASEVLRRLRDRGAGRRADQVPSAPGVQRSSDDEGGDGTVTADHERRLRSTGGVGAPVDGETAVLRRMEGAFGADFGAVRIRTGSDVDIAAAGLRARAFTVGRDVYINRRDYRPGTSAGDELIAHELTHTLQQGGSKIRRRAADPVDVRQRVGGGAHISMKKEKMHLDFVRMKRMDPQFSKIIGKMFGVDVGAEQSGGTYGHWWTEVGELDPVTKDFTYAKSYGWWPKDGVSGVAETLGGVEGALNAGDAQDPHAGEPAPTEFHPVMEVDTAKETYDQIRQRVSNKLDSVAKAYKGQWHWRLGWGKNCHTFQQHLKSKADLHYQKSSKWLYDPAAMKAAKEKQERREAVKHLANEWHDIKRSDITVVDPTTNIERTIVCGGHIGKTGKSMKDLTGFDCVEIVTESGEIAWILKNEWQSWTGTAWTA